MSCRRAPGWAERTGRTSAPRDVGPVVVRHAPRWTVDAAPAVSAPPFVDFDLDDPDDAFDLADLGPDPFDLADPAPAVDADADVAPPEFAVDVELDVDAAADLDPDLVMGVAAPASALEPVDADTPPIRPGRTSP